jgi:hypothetical protein
MKTTTEITEPQEIIQAISNVIPQFTKGDHLIAHLLRSPGKIRFADEQERHGSDLLRVFGLANLPNKEISYDIRLYGTKRERRMGLQYMIDDSSLSNEIFVAWNGGAVSQGENSVYINLVNDTDMEFNLDKKSFGIRSLGGGDYEFSYPIGVDGKAVQRNNQRFFRTKHRFLLSEPWVGPDTVSVLIQKPSLSATLQLLVPKQISRIDLNALPQLS